MSRQTARRYVLIAFVILALLVICAYPIYVGADISHKEARVKQNLHEIQLALERFAADGPRSNYPVERYFPLDVEQLLVQHYLGQFPINPFTRQPMRPIYPGESPYAGEFSYSPLVEGSSVVGYSLTAYGPSKNPDKNARSGYEHAIIVLDSRIDFEQKSAAAP